MTSRCSAFPDEPRKSPSASVPPWVAFAASRCFAFTTGGVAVAAVSSRAASNSRADWLSIRVAYFETSGDCAGPSRCRPGRAHSRARGLIFVCTTGVGTPLSERIVTDRLAGARAAGAAPRACSTRTSRKRPHRRAQSLRVVGRESRARRAARGFRAGRGRPAWMSFGACVHEEDADALRPDQTAPSGSPTR